MLQGIREGAAQTVHVMGVRWAHRQLGGRGRLPLVHQVGPLFGGLQNAGGLGEQGRELG